jgi:tetrahydromethanopterin S-methyltransferase subunit C
MTTVRRFLSAMLSKGVISAGWYSILTGLVLVLVGLALASVARDDPAAGLVGVLLLLMGVWQLERGLRSEFQRRPQPSDDDSEG